MSWFHRRNPTAEWPTRPAVPLVLDLDAFTLNGIGVGDPAAGLELLGPGEAGGRSDEFHFPSRGVTLEIRRGAVRAIHVHFPAFPGTVRFRGRLLRPDSADGVAGWTTLCGDPDVVEDEILTYAVGDREWELLLADGRLKTVSVY